METMIALLLFIAIVIMILLVIIGYLLYTNSKKTASINEIVALKESELIDLYCSLEQIMKETELYVSKAKEEIQTEKERILMLNSQAVKTMEVNETRLATDTQAITVASVQDKFISMKASKVRSFYRKGLSVAEIARELGIGQGEVQLILNLKRSNLSNL